MVVTERPFIPLVQKTIGAASPMTQATQPVEAPDVTTTTQPVETPSVITATQPVKAPDAIVVTGQDTNPQTVRQEVQPPGPASQTFRGTSDRSEVQPTALSLQTVTPKKSRFP